MSSTSVGRHRRDREVSAEPRVLRQQGAATRVGVVAAGAVVAGTALVGAQFAGLNPAQVLGPQHREVALTTGTAPTFDESLATLLNNLGIGNETVPSLIGNTTTVGSLLSSSGLDVSSPLSTLLADLNPSNVTLDAATGGLLTETVSTLLGGSYVDGSPLGGLTIDALATDLLGANPETTTIYQLLNTVGLGSYAGLIDLCTATNLLGVCTGTSITDNSDVSALLQYLVGSNPATETVSGYLSSTDLSGTSTSIANTELGTLLGLTSTQISEPWNQFLDNITISAPLATPETLGNETLGTLLTSLVSTPNLGDLGTGNAVTDSTTLASFLTALDPALGTETVDQLLGLTSTASAEAVASAF